ncbi:MAG TPA: DUF58 domain-containing protein [Dehalococcoidia bacterium]|nr:DUF58 domain-containing protein [Dehalococcoidia bacterium]
MIELFREGWDLLIRRHLSLTVIGVIFVICLMSALSTGYWLPTRLAYVIMLGVPIAYFWARANSRNLDVTVERPVDRLQEGQDFVERITVKNTSWFSKLWLEVNDPSDMPGHNANQVITLGPRESRAWRSTTTCRLRGLFSVGPVTISTGDPFGFFRYTNTYGRPQSILVYPRATELPNFYVPPANLPGEGRFRKRTHYVTPNASGIRPYEYGDSFNRIHWPTTARTGEMMVKLFELDPASDIWIILDLDKSVHVSKGEEGTEEFGIKVAASIARYFLVANRSVGFISFGKRLFVEEAERGAQHYTRILEALALSTAEGDVPVSTLISEESKRFGRHTTVVVITPSTSEEWVGSLQFIAEQGVKVAAVLLEPSTFGGDENSLMVFGALAASDVYTYLVRRSDDLISSLAMGMEGTTTEAIPRNPK